MVLPQSLPDRSTGTWSEAFSLLTCLCMEHDQIQVPDKGGSSSESSFAKLSKGYDGVILCSQAARIFMHKPKALKKQLFRTEKKERKKPIQKNTARLIYSTNISLDLQQSAFPGNRSSNKLSLRKLSCKSHSQIAWVCLMEEMIKNPANSW